MKRSPVLFAMTLALSSLLITGCDKKEDEAAAGAAAQQMPPAVVNVIPAQFQTVPLVQDFSGRTSAYQQAAVRPQVTGVIDEILYREGGMVKKDQPLYKLSLDNYTANQAASQAAVQQAVANVHTSEASFNNALANVQSRQAELTQAASDLEKLRPLVAQKAISQQQYEQAETRYKTAQAALQSAQAAAQQAQAGIASSQAAVESAKAQLSGSQLDIERTIVRAPIEGVTERSNFTVGALVNANQADPLVVISKLDPIYVDISQSSAEFLRLQQRQAMGEIQQGDNSVELILEDGSTYPAKGRLLLAEAKVDQESGAVTLRAIFPNPQYRLLPGMFVTARITQGLLTNALLLPQSAVMRSPKGETQVYIVDANNKIQVRPIEINGTYKGDWVVTDGIQAGENIVVIGGAKVQPEQEVVSKPLEQQNIAMSNSTPQTSSSKPTPTQNNSSDLATPQTSTSSQAQQTSPSSQGDLLQAPVGPVATQSQNQQQSVTPEAPISDGDTQEAENGAATDTTVQ